MVYTRGIGDRNPPTGGGFQIDMLESHRVRGDDFHRGRNLLEKCRIQPVREGDEHGVCALGRGEELLLAQERLVRVSSGGVIAVNTIFNVLRIMGGYHQNWFSHTGLFLLREIDSKTRVWIFLGPFQET